MLSSHPKKTSLVFGAESEKAREELSRDNAAEHLIRTRLQSSLPRFKAVTRKFPSLRNDAGYRERDLRTQREKKEGKTK